MSKELDDALKSVNKSLDPALWIDVTHLYSKHGKKFFDDLKNVVKKLEKVVKYSADCAGDASRISNDLLAVALRISTEALEEATALCAESGDCGEKLDRANKEMEEYLEEIAKGHVGHGIEKLKKVWEHAVKAVEKVSIRMINDQRLEAATLGRSIQIPEEFSLEGNFPNPFNPQTTIRFGVPETSDVRLAVYDMLGREVKVLVHGTVSAGVHEAAFDAARLPSGSYFYQLTTPEGTISKMMLLLK